MSDSNIPPDDFSATTPNIKVPKKDSPDFSNQSASDWEKTNYNYSPKDLQQDEWNKTAYNTPKTPPPDFDKNNFSSQPRDAEWGKTQVNINLPGNQSNQFSDNPYEDYGSKRSDFNEFDEEPRYREPKQEPKYQEPPKKETVEESKENKKKGGVPGWLWASAALLGMFLFAVATLVGVYFLFLGKTGFEVIVKNVPAGSDVLVNGSYWGVTDSDGSIRLKTLKAGETKAIEIKNPSFKCVVKPEISLDEAKDGRSEPVSRTAQCESTGKTTGNDNPQNLSKECQNITDLETSHKCANIELDKIEGKEFTVEQLLRAMNLYIINFDPNKAVIRNDKDLKFIERAAGFMKKLPNNIVVEIGGHTDSDGTDAKNQPLSEDRATAVRNALVKFQVTSTMLRTKGYGSKQPVASNDTPEGKFKNRRIEYKVIS